MRVLLADDHALFRAGIASLLEAWGMEVVGEASDGFEAFEKTCRLRPDLVLMDIGMGRCDGLEATRLIKAELPETRIVMVTISDNEDHLFEAIKSGAEGYLLKNMPREELSHVLTAIAAGETAFSRGLAMKILDEYSRLAREGPAQEDSDGLTSREREVLQLLADGSTNRDIASALYISENTVKFHMRNILAKLHLRNRAQAVAYVIRTGLGDAAFPPEP